MNRKEYNAWLKEKKHCDGCSYFVGLGKYSQIGCCSFYGGARRKGFTCKNFKKEERKS